MRLQSSVPIIKIRKKNKSLNCNIKGIPYVDLIKGDVVELREDGIYFTRKIRLSGDGHLTKKEASLQAINGFNAIKRQNEKTTRSI